MLPHDIPDAFLLSVHLVAGTVLAMVSTASLVKLPGDTQLIVPQLVVLGLREIDGMLVYPLLVESLVEEVVGVECHLHPSLEERLVGTDAPVLVRTKLGLANASALVETIRQGELVIVWQREIVVERGIP